MTAKGRSVTGGTHGAYEGSRADSPFDLLTREQDRKLRADAWRHVYRINPVMARRIRRAHRG